MRGVHRKADPEQTTAYNVAFRYRGNLTAGGSTMSRMGTLTELFLHSDFTRNKLLDQAAGQSDAQLDQSFDIGLGTLRLTLHHLWAAERIWLDRWLGRTSARLAEPPPRQPVAELRRLFDETGAERNEWLSRQTDETLERPLTYTNTRGQTLTFRLADMLTHVCNHGVHHRAQAINMLRQLGTRPPRGDYIFMKIEQPSPAPPTLSPTMIREYFEYGDWANGRMLEAMAGLSDESLDRTFDIGSGTLRRTMLHVRDAEQWWLGNWMHGPQQLFPPMEEGAALPEIRRRIAQTATDRRAYMQALSSEDLKRTIKAQPVAGVFRTLTLGESMLQLCTHGTHHRAQALNMLRRLGAKPPEIDYVVRLRM